jgi:hypothetical protein
VDAEGCANLAVAYTLLNHDEDVSTKLFFVRISQPVFGGLWNGDGKAVDMPS